jgi:hypothetical protein
MAANKTSWKKGQSGNPNGSNGRAPATPTLTQKLRRRVDENGGADELLAALWACAVGHWVKDTDKKGEERVYLVGPEVKALALIFERLEGKAPQALELRTPDGGLLVGRMTPEERREYLRRIAGQG